jgi:hypothetical protein
VNLAITQGFTLGWYAPPLQGGAEEWPSDANRSWRGIDKVHRGASRSAPGTLHSGVALLLKQTDYGNPRFQYKNSNVIGSCPGVTVERRHHEPTNTMKNNFPT